MYRQRILPRARRVRFVLTLLGVAVLAVAGCSCDDPVDDDTVPVDDDDSTGPVDDDSSEPADDDDSAGFAWLPGDSAQLAPDAGNSVGLYDLAVCPGGDEVYFTNLHYHGVGVASAADGSLLDVIDIDEATGGTVPLFPYVVCLPGSGLLVLNDRMAGQLLRIDPLAREVLDVHPVCNAPAWMEVDPVDGDLLVACIADSRIVQLDRDTLASVRTWDLGVVGPSRFTATADHLLVVDEIRELVAVFERDGGALADQFELEGWPNQVAVYDAGRAFLTDRTGGRLLELDAILPLTAVQEWPAGSDTFGVTAVPQRGRVYAVARQGAEVPDGGTYSGDPGVVYALDPASGTVAAEVEVGKTPHFAVYDEVTDRLYTGGEDSLDLSAIGPADELLWTSAAVGVTLDDAAVDPTTGRTWFPSHLSDEVWVYDWAAHEATRLSASGWPFAVDIDVDARRVYVATQQRARLDVFDADSLERVAQHDLGVESHQVPCDPLCTGHFAGVDLAVDPARGVVWVAHPPGVSLLRLDLASGVVDEVVIDEVAEPEPGEFFQHMSLAVEPATGRTFAYYGLEDRVVAVEGDEVVDEAEVHSAAGRPLVFDADRSRVLVGASVLDRDLAEVGALPVDAEFAAHLAGPDLYLALSTEAIWAVDAASLEVLSSLQLGELQTPPFWAGQYNLSPVLVFPLRPPGRVLVINVFEGTAEVVDPSTWAPVEE